MQPARDDTPLVVELSGDSMQPGLPRGCRLRVERLSTGAGLEPGQIVVLRGPQGLVVHRLVGRYGPLGQERLVHRGDAAGRLGVAAGSALVGRVAAVLAPELELPTLERLAPAERAAFERARRKAAWYARLSACGRVLSSLGLRLPGPAAWLRERLLS
jgi:hypothetical protein